MFSIRHTSRTALAATVAFAAALGCSSCRPLALFHAPGPLDVWPTPDSPQNAVALLRWSWIQRSTDAARLVYSAAYRFDLTPADSIDNAPIGRDDELSIERHLFMTGTATEPPANRDRSPIARDCLVEPILGV